MCYLRYIYWPTGRCHSRTNTSLSTPALTMVNLFKLPLLFTLLVTLANAHPGEDHTDEANSIKSKRSFFEHHGRSYSSCNNAPHKRDLNNRLAERRSTEIAHLRAELRATKESAIHRRQDVSSSGMMTGPMPSETDGAGGSMPSGSSSGGGSGGSGGSTSFDTYGESLLNTSHASNRTDINATSTSSTIFDSSDDDTTCLLQPEATIGPYFVSGEYVRDDMSESEPGIPIYMSTQVIDVGSCSPVVGLYWEMWHANVSGVYSGVVASGNGDSSDESNLNNTALRGITPTDDMGVATMKSVFPGHYTGRATHVHVVGHTNVTVYENGTIGTGSTGDGDSVALHISQLFFDQTLLDEVATILPYSENTQTVTENSEDSILAGLAVEGASDPFFEYVLLGDDVSDGIYAWVTVGITTNTSYTTSPASVYTEEGGYVNDAEGDLSGGTGEYYSYSAIEAVASASASASTSTIAVASGSTSTGSADSSGTSAESSGSTTTASSNGAARNCPTLAVRPGALIQGAARHMRALFS